MTFEQMNLDKNIIQALHTLGYETIARTRTSHSQYSFGKKIVSNQKTGSGKTASLRFLLFKI